MKPTDSIPKKAPRAAAPVRMQFDARVEPFWAELNANRPNYSTLELWRQKRRLTRILKLIRAELAAQGVELPADWDKSEAPTACHIRIDKMGVFQEVRQYANEIQNPSQPDLLENRFEPNSFMHVLRHRERQSYYLPVDFPEPFNIQPESGADLVPVASSIRAAEELDRMNRELKVESSFKIKGMKDFVEATEANIAQFESSFNSADRFWVKFGFLVLQRLVKQSVAHKLPVIFQ
ncbi:MAG: hypothetical protein HYY93_06945 [Planctomycetes bacterium]|nr:hypothetical protein [Planctomycetota bacterium]